MAPEPLTPSRLILMKSKVALPPPGKFVKEDMYAALTMVQSTIFNRTVLEPVEERVPPEHVQAAKVACTLAQLKSERHSHHQGRYTTKEPVATRTSG